MLIDSEKIWYKAGRTIVKAGNLPMVVNETLLELLKLIMTEEQADFISIFRKPSLSIYNIRQNNRKNVAKIVYFKNFLKVCNIFSDGLSDMLSLINRVCG